MPFYVHLQIIGLVNCKLCSYCLGSEIGENKKKLCHFLIPLGCLQQSEYCQMILHWIEASRFPLIYNNTGAWAHSQNVDTQGCSSEEASLEQRTSIFFTTPAPLHTQQLLSMLSPFATELSTVVCLPKCAFTSAIITTYSNMLLLYFETLVRHRNARVLLFYSIFPIHYSNIFPHRLCPYTSTVHSKRSMVI